MTQPEKRSDLAATFAAEEMRIPLPDYSATIRERRYLERVLDLGGFKWFRSQVRELDVESLMKMASELREDINTRLRVNLDHFVERKGYDRKCRIPKLRYDAGRLLYLGRKIDLTSLTPALSEIPEFTIIGHVYGSVSTRDVSGLLSLGANAVQSAAQVLCLNTGPVRCQPKHWTEVESQGLAILRLNGLNLEFGEPHDLPNDELNRLASSDKSATSLMRSADPFIRELACLHGGESARRFSSLLNSAFDGDEALAFDAINQLNQSDSGFIY